MDELDELLSDLSHTLGARTAPSRAAPTSSHAPQVSPCMPSAQGLPPPQSCRQRDGNAYEVVHRMRPACERHSCLRSSQPGGGAVRPACLLTLDVQSGVASHVTACMAVPKSGSPSGKPCAPMVNVGMAPLSPPPALTGHPGHTPNALPP